MKLRLLLWKIQDKLKYFVFLLISIIILGMLLWILHGLFNYLYEDTYYKVTIIVDSLASFLTLLGIVFAGKQLSDAKKLNESQFVMELNNDFISNDKMTSIERELEHYFIGNTPDEYLFEIWKDITPERQDLISYLVYFEGLSVSVQRKIISMNSMDDLFSYRFFLAFHNPVVQKLELKEYSHYYRGCYVLYFLISEVWLKRWILWKDSGADETIDSPEIPLSAYSLYTDPEVQKFMLKNKLISKRKLKKIDKMAKYLNLNANE